MNIVYGNLLEINNFYFKFFQNIRGRKIFKLMKFLFGFMQMVDLILFKWNIGKSYNQCFFKRVGFFFNSIFK